MSSFKSTSASTTSASTKDETTLGETTQQLDSVTLDNDSDSEIPAHTFIPPLPTVQQAASLGSTLGSTLGLSTHSYFQPPNHFKITLYSPNQNSTKSTELTTLIIPPSRTSEYTFTNPNSISQLYNQVNSPYSLILLLPPLHLTLTPSEIQTLSSPILKKIISHYNHLAPSTSPTSTIMSISGGTNNVELLKTPSLLITECDHTTPSTRVRRLYFTSNSNVIQSESYLQNSTFDYTKLSFGYHYIMSSSIYLTTPEISRYGYNNKSVVVGLGGGQFSMYLSKVMKLNITSIEISSTMKNLAAEYFGFEEGENNEVQVGDGIEAVGEFKGLDNVFVDVDTKDDSVGMSCPPGAFVETSYLSEVHSSLNPSGKIIINVSARDKSCLETLLKNVNKIFNTVYISDSMPEEVNVVVIGFKEAPEVPDKKVLMERVEGEDMKEAICMWRKWKKKTRGGKKKK